MIKRAYYYLFFLVLALIYIILSLLAPLGPNRYNLTPSKTHALQLTIVLPVVLIWAIAIYGAERFHNYTSWIKDYKDGRAMDIVSTGLLLLVGAIIANGFIGLLRPWARADGWLSPYTIFSNYMSVVLPLIAYSVMFYGSLKLLKLIKPKKKSSPVLTVLMTIFLILIGSIYFIVLLNYKHSTSTPDPGLYSSFYMSRPLILLTLGLPYLISWGLGIMAVININRYRNQINGVIYKGAMFRVLIGLLIVISFYIFVQMLVAFSTYFASAGLASILIFIYMLILLYALGFLIIASGAKRLSDIEKVK